ncbi:unnamed protein product, partial [Schistosoma mattheei]
MELSSTSHEQINSQIPIKTKHSHTKNHRNIKDNENNYQWVINPIHKKSQHELDQIPIINNNNNISYHDYSLNRLNIEKHKSRSKSKVLEKSETLDMETSKDIFTRSVSAHPILMNTPQLPPKIYKNYRLYRCDRETRRGGGCIIYALDTLATNIVEDSVLNSLPESVWISVNTLNHSLLLGCIYRAPDSSNNGNDLIINALIHASSLNFNAKVITGDFNYPGINWIT